MRTDNNKILVIGGAGLIGSHVVDQLTQSGVKEIWIYDNFVRGTLENLNEALKDPRVKIFEAGGDICQVDILDRAAKGMDGVFCLAALWLLQCHEFPRAAFEVNVRGAFNVMEACVANKVKRLVFSSSASVYGDALTEPMAEDHPFNNKNFYGATKICDEVEIEDDVFCGPSMVFTNVFNPRAAISRKHEYRKTLVKSGATIGANATIICGLTLGEHCFIGAGTVVTKNVNSYALVVGVPGREVGRASQKGIIIRKNRNSGCKIKT